ncbi:MAG: hypothetical protein IJQ72_04185 [Bacilli bacterium]|nr:hypothetical protein [Bacilli bacterium]
MIPTIIIVCSTFLLVILSILFFPHIKLGKIKLDTYWMIALLGAIILLACSYAPINQVGEQLISSSAINPLKILVLFFSMTLISIFLDELGLFRYLASVASKNAKGKQITLFLLLYLLTSVLTVFTSNDIVILTLTPFICFFSKRSKISPIPYLVAEFTAANTWSLMFVIGNPTNIYLATSSGITFVEYLKVMAIPTLVAGIVELSLLLLIFHKQLKQPLQSNDIVYPIEDKVPVIVGLSVLGTCLVFLIISSYINLEMWLISLVCAGTLLVFMLIYSCFKKSNFVHVKETGKRLPYQLIPFFLSMFVIVVALNEQGIASKIAELLGNNNSTWVYGYSSFLACNLINNIPMSILYTNIASSLQGVAYTKAIYASIIGSNIGAFLTPIGALAGIMFTDLVNENNVRFTFIDFIKYGVIISIPVLTVCLGMSELFI